MKLVLSFQSQAALVAMNKYQQEQGLISKHHLPRSASSYLGKPRVNGTHLVVHSYKQALLESTPMTYISKSVALG